MFWLRNKKIIFCYALLTKGLESSEIWFHKVATKIEKCSLLKFWLNEASYLWMIILMSLHDLIISIFACSCERPSVTVLLICKMPSPAFRPHLSAGLLGWTCNTKSILRINPWSANYNCTWLQQTTNFGTSFQIFDKNKVWYYMRIMKYHALFVILKKAAKFEIVVCCKLSVAL